MVEVLADGLWAYRLGGAAFALIFPLMGALLLGVGIHRRRVFNRWNSRDDDRLLHPQPTLDGEDDFDDEFDPRLRDDYDPDYDYEDLEPQRRGARRPDPRPSQPPGKGTVFIAVGAVVLVLGALHVLSTLVGLRTTAEGSSVEVGQCITAQAYELGRMNAEPVDCARSDATLQLASKGDGTATCPDGPRYGSLYSVLNNEIRTQCFILNLREGHCYAVVGLLAQADCTDSATKVKVARRVDGTSEAVGCPSEARVISYPEPARVYCFVAP